MKSNKILLRMEKSIINGDKEEAIATAIEAIKIHMDLNKAIEKGYIPGIQKVGILWEQGDYFLPELITSAECMKAAMSILEPELVKNKISLKSLGTIIIGTVEGDIHDIGKSLVASMLAANGFQVIDLGADVKLEKFIEKAEKENADLICLSALLTTTMLGQKKLVEMLQERKLSGRFQVMVGGAPVTQEWANEIHADAYAENAVMAIETAKKLLGK